MGWFDRPEYGPNVGLIDDVYRQYLDDPTSVSEAWREFFAEHEPEEPEGAPGEQARETPAPAPTPRAGTQEPPPARAAGQEAERAAEPRAAVQAAERRPGSCRPWSPASRCRPRPRSVWSRRGCSRSIATCSTATCAASVAAR